MKIYEQRTYTFTMKTMPDVLRMYRKEVYPVMEAEGFAENLVGFFTTDTGTVNQLVHLWRFDDDTARRTFWKDIAMCEAFASAASPVIALMEKLEIQLLRPAPWGPQP